MADDPDPQKTEPARAPDLTKAVEALLKQHGDAAGAVRALLSDRDAATARVRELEAKLPGAGSVVLTGDEAVAWNDYRQLGKAADLRQALADRDRYQTEADGFRKAESIRSAAEIAGYKPSVLAKLAADLTLVVQEEKNQAGQPEKVVYVQGEGGQTTPLSAYAQQHWADFLPSLQAEPAPPRAGPGPGPAPRSGLTPPRPALVPQAQTPTLRRMGI